MPLAQGGSVVVSSAQITDDIIINADINSAAAIAYSKLDLAAKLAIADLAAGTDGELITWDANGAAAAVAVGTLGRGPMGRRPAAGLQGHRANPRPR